MTRPDCPDESVLVKVHSGLLTEEELKGVEPHLATCSDCATRIEQLAGQDTLAGGSAPAAGSKEDQKAVENLIAKIHALPQAPLATSAKVPAGQTSGDSPSAELGFLSPAEQQDELGRLGGYRVLRLLGQGGMGLVFEAEDLQLRRRVALKVIRPALAADEKHRARLLREARAAAALQHDHVVSVFQVGEERGVPFIVMPLLAGETLEARLKREGRLEPQEAARIGAEAAAGLAAAHAKGLVHRDLKPANLWLEEGTGRVKVLDFGVVRTGGDDTNLTAAHTLVGTPAYMSPEQAGGEELDARADLFSLGAVLYHSLTGQLPFPGKTLTAILAALCTKTPLPPVQLQSEIPAGLSQVVQQLLSKEPGDRPQSAKAVAESLRPYAQPAVAPVAQPAPAMDGIGSRPWLPWTAVALGLLAILGWFYGVTIIRVVTNHGELVVAIDDPDITLTIVQGSAVLEDKKGNRVFVLTAEAGEILVKEKDGVQLLTRKFELTRGETKRVSVSLAELAEARKPKPGVDPATKPEPVYPTPPTQPVIAAMSPLDTLDPAAIPESERYPWQPKELVAVIGSHKRRGVGSDPYAVPTADGQRIVTGNGEIFDVASGRVISLSGENSIWLVGKQFVAAKHPKVPPGTREIDFRHASVSADGKRIVAPDFHAPETGHTIYVWDFVDGELKPLASKTGCQLSAISTNGMILAVSRNSDYVVEVYDIVGAELKRRCELRGPEGVIKSGADQRRLQFLPDGRLVTLTGDSTLGVWDVTGTEPKIVTTEKRVDGSRWTHFSLSKDGRRLCAWDQNGVGLYEVGDNSIVKRSSRHMGDAFSMHVGSSAFMPDGNTLVTGHACGAVRLWDISGKEIVERDPLPIQPWVGKYDRAPLLSPDATRLVSESATGKLVEWKFGGNRPVLSIARTEDRVETHSFSPDGKRLLITENDYAPILLRLVNGEWQTELKIADKVANPLTFLSDANTFVSQIEGKLVTFRIEQGKARELTSTPFAGGGGETMISANGGRTLVLAHATDQPLTLWDVTKDGLTKQCTLPVPGPRMPTVSPDGQILAVCSSGTDGIFLWTLRDGKPTRPDKFDPGHGAICVSFDPTGKRLASGGVDGPKGKITIWEVATGKPLYAMELGRPVASIQYAPDGRHLIAGNADGTIYILRLPAVLGPLDALDPAAIPQAERYPWQPKELVAVIGSHQWQTEGEVRALAPSPDRKRIEVGGLHSSGVVLDIPAGRTLETIPAELKFACYSANGKRYLDSRGLWDVTPERKLLAPPFLTSHFGMLDAGGKRVLTLDEQQGSASKLRVWEMAEGKVHVVAERAQVEQAVLSQDGELVALVRAADGVLELNAISGRELKKLCEVPVSLGKRSAKVSSRSRLAFVAEGQLATLSDDATLRLWALSPQREEAKPVSEQKVKHPGFLLTSNDGRRICLFDQTGFAVYDVVSQQLKLRGERDVVDAHRMDVTAAAFSPDAAELFTGHLGGAVRRWNIAGDAIAELTPKSSDNFIDYSSRRPLISRDGTFLAVPHANHQLAAWRLGGPRPERLPGGEKDFAPVQFLDDGRLVANREGTPAIFRLGEELRLEEVLGSIHSSFAFAVSPDGQAFAAQHVVSPELALYRSELGKISKVASVETAGQGYPSLHFAAGGKVLVWRAAQDIKDPLSIWDVAAQGITFQATLPVSHPGIPAVSPDGLTLAVGSPNGIHLWGLHDGKPTRPDRWDHKAAKYFVGFDSTGRRLVSGGNGGDGTTPGSIVVWDFGTGKPLYETATGRNLRHVQFAPDGRHLIAGNVDGTIYILRLPAHDSPPNPPDPAKVPVDRK